MSHKHNRLYRKEMLKNYILERPNSDGYVVFFKNWAWGVTPRRLVECEHVICHKTCKELLVNPFSETDDAKTSLHKNLLEIEEQIENFVKRKEITMAEFLEREAKK